MHPRGPGFSPSMTTFEQLFKGAQVSHGCMTRENRGWTANGPATPEDYAKHLRGDLGLGVVPLLEDATCGFGVLDIDVDDIDHQALYRKVRHRNLPLTVCRSRSGAAHLYCFFNPPMKSALARQLLRGWSGLLGYPSCEVFPKQDAVDDSNKGSWINLPYFGGEDTTRYAVGDQGAMTLEDFLGSVEYYDPHRKINKELPQIGEDDYLRMPPCLESIMRTGLGEGGRNDALVNFAVLYRKLEPNSWQDRTRKHNQENFKPPLDHNEVEGVIESVQRRGYGYTCEKPVLVGRCDRQACLKREFGINHTQGKEPGRYHSFTCNNLRKILLDDPRYKLEVNGMDVDLGSDEIHSYATMRKVIMTSLNLMIPIMKQDKWEITLKGMLDALVEVEVPDDAGKDGLTLYLMEQFLGMSERTRNGEEDILKGMPYKNETHIWFRSSDLINFLNSKKAPMDPGELFMLMQVNGGLSERRTIKGKTLTVWGMPVPSSQTEPFTQPPEPNRLEDDTI